MKKIAGVAIVAALSLLLLGQGPFDPFQFTLRAASGSLSAGETASAVDGIGGFDICTVFLDITTITTPDGDDEVDFYLQTTYDDSTWVDLSNVHLATGDNGTTQQTIIVVAQAAAGTAQTDDPSEAAISDDTNADFPVGSQMRIKTTVTGATAPTYAYSAQMHCK